MSKEIIKFDNTEIEKHKFHQHKNPISMYYVDINKIVVSSKFSLGKKGFKYFIGYEDIKKVRPLCIMLLKMTSTVWSIFSAALSNFWDLFFGNTRDILKCIPWQQ